jgi:hypothetical protein
LKSLGLEGNNTLSAVGSLLLVVAVAVVLAARVAITLLLVKLDASLANNARVRDACCKLIPGSKRRTARYFAELARTHLAKLTSAITIARLAGRRSEDTLIALHLADCNVLHALRAAIEISSFEVVVDFAKVWRLDYTKGCSAVSASLHG